MIGEIIPNIDNFDREKIASWSSSNTRLVQFIHVTSGKVKVGVVKKSLKSIPRLLFIRQYTRIISPLNQ